MTSKAPTTRTAIVPNIVSGLGNLAGSFLQSMAPGSCPSWTPGVSVDAWANSRLGGEFGGWSLYAKNGKLKYCYNLFGQMTNIT